MLNRTNFHEERSVYRIVTGTTHPVFGAIPDTGCIPFPDTKTGTFSTDNTDSSLGKTVLGVGTLFLSELIEGSSHIYFSGAVRLVKRIFSDTLAELEYKFPSTVTAQPVKVPPINKYRQQYAESIGTEDAVLQEAPFPAGSNFLNGGAPVTYDVSESSTNHKIAFTLSI